MPFAQTPQGLVHWADSGTVGDAAPVVLLHGLGGDAGFWEAEMAILAGRFRVLAVDFRGSGQSLGNSQAFSISDLADDVVSVLDACSVSSAHIVGFSMGGLVAQALAVNAPERVLGLVLASTFATTPPQARRFLEAVGSVYRSGATAGQMFDLVLPWLFSEQFFEDARSAPYLAGPEDAADEQLRDDWFRLLDAQLAFDGRPALSRIRAPTLIIAGAEDRLAPLSSAEQLERCIDRAVLRVLPGGHLMNVEAPADFVAALETFFWAFSN